MVDGMRSKKLALTSLLVWYSFHQQPRILVDGRPPLSLQHRVKRSHRRVEYTSKKRRRIASSAHSARRNLRTSVLFANSASEDGQSKRDLRREVHSDGALWVFANDNNLVERRIDKDSVSAESSAALQESSSHRVRRPLWRQLYDQFVGEDLPPSDGYGSETNGFFGDPTNASDLDAIGNPGEESTLVLASNVTKSITTAVVGNSTNTTTGNITESVVYTTNSEEVINATDFDSLLEETTNTTETFNGNHQSSFFEGDDLEIEEEPQFQPLRLRAILTEDSGKGSILNVTEREILFYDLLSPALLAWSSSLRVDPVVGNLTVDVHQLVDGVTCGPGLDSGLPSVKVPRLHMEEGVADTDMIVYLSLGFTEVVEESIDNNNINNNNETDIYEDGGEYTSQNADTSGFGNGDDDDDDYDSKRERDTTQEPISEDEAKRRFLTTLLNPDVPNTNEEIRMVGRNETPATINICTGEYLAAASYCSTDQFDRPTAALLHLCIDNSFFDPKVRQRNIMTLVHELGHALGFNALSMAHFRKPDGTPYTPRNRDGDVPDTVVECTGPEDHHQVARLPLPSKEVLQFRNVRGGVRVAEIVTPSVVQVVRNQFDCQLLTGAELESSEGSPLVSSSLEGNIGAGSCLGDHWERRLFSSDVMNPIVDDIEYSTRISTLTLAYFADSGWYQVDLSNANVASGWGRGAGCNFVNDTCINEFGDVPPQNAPFFCNEVSRDMTGLSLPQNIHGCTPDLSRKARCSIGLYDLDLPKAYQYFNSTLGSKVGGSDTLMDYCPVYDGYDNGLCSNKASEAVIRANEIERFGLRNSRCLVGNVRNSLFTQQNTALCLPIACVLEDRSLRIKLGETWHICEYASQTIESADKNVEIACPDPRRICPTFFCPYDCLGTGGECDYDSGKCLCRYQNATHPNETILDVCGLEQEDYEESTTESKNRTAASTTKSETKVFRPILHRKGKIDSLMPPSDAKISDYYVSDVLHLDDSPRFVDAIGILILSMTALVMLSFFIVLFTFRKPLKEASASTCNYIRRFSVRDIRGDTDGIGPEGPHDDTREKHKMVASVLVDLRIREHDQGTMSRWRRRSQVESLAETDGRMTDSEIGSSAPPGALSDSLSEVSSSRQMLDESLSSEFGEDAKEETLEPPAIMRRRRFSSNLFS